MHFLSTEEANACQTTMIMITSIAVLLTRCQGLRQCLPHISFNQHTNLVREALLCSHTTDEKIETQR